MFVLSRRSALLAAVCLTLPVAGRAAIPSPNWQQHPWQLMMVGTPSCEFCQAWHRGIAPSYPQSSAGRVAPLFNVDIDGPYPDGLALERRPRVTPTFVLLFKGAEVGRIEGLDDNSVFYPSIQRLMHQAGILSDKDAL